jgi:hypothetical protein
MRSPPSADEWDFVLRAERRQRRRRSDISPYFIASGLTGDPTAPVIGMAGATNMNS